MSFGGIAAAVAGGVAGAGAGYGLSQIDGGGEGGGGGGGTQGYFPSQYLSYPQYDFTLPMYKQLYEYNKGGLESLDAGSYGKQWERASPFMKKRLSKGLRDTYTGSYGNLGLIDYANASGALLGTGPKPAFKKTNALLQKWADQESEIDQYLEELGYKQSQQAEQNYMSSMAQIPQGPAGQVVGGGPYNVPAGTNYGSQIAGGIAKMLPDLAKMLPDLLKGWRTPTTTGSQDFDFSQLTYGAYEPMNTFLSPNYSSNPLTYNPVD